MIGLVSDSGPLRGKLQAGVLVEPTRLEIVRVARNKLRLPKKFELELFLQEREGGGSKAKVRTRLEGNDFAAVLRKGCVVVAARAEDEQAAGGDQFPIHCCSRSVFVTKDGSTEL